MKNPQKGFAIPLLIAIIVVLAIGGGVYYCSQILFPKSDSQVGAVAVSTTTTSTKNISSCQNITRPGNYILTKNILNASSTPCMGLV